MTTTSESTRTRAVEVRPGDGKQSGSRRLIWLEQQLAAALMHFLILIVLAAAAALWWSSPVGPPLQWAVVVLKTFTIWCMTFVPCWLYIRFLGQRAGAIWDEYVINLHRLALDEPRFLPRPPSSSQYFQEWEQDGGADQEAENIYHEKFNAYYGRSVADSAHSQDFHVRVDALFPVFLSVVVFSVGWVAVLWDDHSLVEPRSMWDVLKYGFLGSYVFIVQMLLRRFFASDLRPSAYAAAMLRIATTLISVAVAYLALEVWFTDLADGAAAAVIAFALGFLPLVAMRFIIKVATAPMRMASQSLESDYPLYQLDGMNVWYEARLAEENIDDMQTLTTANLVDVILHTRLPVGRLIDWIDQSYLYLHQDRVERGRIEHQRAHKPSAPAQSADPAVRTRTAFGSSVRPASRVGTVTRTALRHLGIRTATDLLKAFPPTSPTSPESTYAGLHRDDVAVLARVLSEQQGLAPVWNWYDRGIRSRCPIRRPPSFDTCWVAQQRHVIERSQLATTNK